MSEAAIAHAPAPEHEPASGRPREPSHVWRIDGATWADFQRLLELRGDRPIKSMIGCLVEAWCMERDVDIMPYGSWLLESKIHRRGIEPDECYVVGEVTDPERPDLAIEVVWTGNAYEPIERSEVLPGLDHEQLLRYVDFLSVTKAAKEHRAALRG